MPVTIPCIDLSISPANKNDVQRRAR